VAQLILEKIELQDPHEVQSLEETERGSSGFGSTGTSTNQMVEEYLIEEEVNFMIMKDHEVSSQDIQEPHVIPEEYADLKELFEDKEIGILPPHRPYDHAIKLEPGTTAPFGPMYNLSKTELEELRKNIDENLAKGFIRRSESPAGAPVLFVKKKDGTLRLCVDYRALNKITVKNRCPLPLINETMDQLKDATIFSKIDLKGAYNLIRIAEGDEWKTAFRTRYGHFEYLVMPFGLTNAPATFQAFINDVLREYLDHFVVVYLDDILIYSKSKEEHIEHVRKVMKTLLDAQLQAKLSKCEFHKDRVEFLGFVISKEGISMDPKKVQTIQEWKSPSSVHDIQVFLGFANFYRRFIKNFAKEVAPITRLLKKDTKFQWDDNAEQAFLKLKEIFTKGPLLRHFNQEKRCIIETDASKTAIGAICSQECEDGLVRPIAYYSRSLTPAERNYHVHDTELLAIIEALETWRHYLAYSKEKTLIYTDHKNLLYFTEKRKFNARQVRWSHILEDYNFEIVYRSGAKNKAADALSRKDSEEEPKGGESFPNDKPILDRIIGLNPLESLPLIPENSDLIRKIKDVALQDDTFFEIFNDLTNDPDSHPEYSKDENLLYYQGRIYVPDNQDIKREILQQCHDDPLSGHYGLFKTHELVSRSFYWPGMRAFTKKFVLSCDLCQRTKTARHKPYGLLKPLEIPEQPWSSISMDMITQLPKSKGHDAILVIVDRFTKMTHLAPTTSEATSEDIAQLLIEIVVAKHGIPDDIVSDRGTVFTSQFMKAFANGLGIKQNLSTAFHPRTDGQTERMNGVLEQYLRNFLNYQQDNWSDLLPLAEFSYNNTVHATTNQTPFYANYGYHPRFNVALPRVNSNVPRAESRLENLQEIQEDLKFFIQDAQDTQARYFNQHAMEQPDFQIGDKVWLIKKNIKTTRPSNKLDYRKLGPFKILEKIGTRAYKLELPQSMSRIHPVFHVSLLEPYVINDIPGRVLDPPLAIEVEDQLEYEVEDILDSRKVRNQLQYLVHWKGYSIADRSWEPAENISARRTLAKFHTTYPSKPGLQEFQARYPDTPMPYQELVEQAP